MAVYLTHKLNSGTNSEDTILIGLHDTGFRNGALGVKTESVKLLDFLFSIVFLEFCIALSGNT